MFIISDAAWLLCWQGGDAPDAVLGGGSDDAYEQGYSTDEQGYSSDDDTAAAPAVAAVSDAGYSSADRLAAAAAVEPDAAYLGMARKSAAGAVEIQTKQQQQQQEKQHKQKQPVSTQETLSVDADPQQVQKPVVVAKPQRSVALQGMSLAEQEALALQLLTSRPW